MEVRASCGADTCACAPTPTHPHPHVDSPERAKEEGHIRHCLADSPTQPSQPRPSHASGDRPGPDGEWRALGGQHGNHQSAESPEALSSPPLSVAIMIGQFRPRSPAFPVEERPGTSPGLARGRRPAGHATGTRSLAPNRYRVTPNETLPFVIVPSSPSPVFLLAPSPPHASENVSFAFLSRSRTPCLPVAPYLGLRICALKKLCIRPLPVPSVR
jgi:hypothetical protein